MYKTPSFAVILLILMSFLNSCHNRTRNDLDMLCQIAQTIQQEQFESSEEKLTAFITESYEQDFTSETKKFLQGLTFQQSSPTYQDFIDFATVHELPNWECKALKTLLSQTN